MALLARAWTTRATSLLRAHPPAVLPRTLYARPSSTTRGARAARSSFYPAAPNRARTAAAFSPFLARALATAHVPPATPATPALALVRRVLLLRAALYTGGSVAALGVVLYAYASWSEASVRRAMLRAFEEGGRPGWEGDFDDGDADIARPALEADLGGLLRLDATREYVVIVGETGTGKSTAVRQAVRALPAPKGVVYFDAPELLPKFGLKLARAVSYTPYVADPPGALRRWLSGTTKEEVDPKLKAEPLATWAPLQDALEEVAKEYKATHGQTPTLVIDAADLVAKQDKAFFLRIQDFAKRCADNKIMTVVFVSSEGAVLPALLESSAFSRAHRVFEVGDIPDADAVAFLVHRGVPRERAENVVHNITGGRLTKLRHYAGCFTTTSDSQFRKELDTKTKTDVQRAGLKVDNALFRHLVVNQRVDHDLAESLVGKGNLEALLKANVLATHADLTYTFHARYVETFFRAAVAEVDKRAAEEEARRKAAAAEDDAKQKATVKHTTTWQWLFGVQ